MKLFVYIMDLYSTDKYTDRQKEDNNAYDDKMISRKGSKYINFIPVKLTTYLLNGRY